MAKISIACDHAAYELKDHLVGYIKSKGFDVIDHGTNSDQRVDYPDFAEKVAKDVQSGSSNYGILVCGTGIGMALSANKFQGVRAASLTDVYSCQMTRQHNNLNVLCLGSRVVGLGLAELLVDTFLQTEFEGGRHAERVSKISEIEKKNFRETV